MSNGTANFTKSFKHSAKSVLLDFKQYLSFFLALLIVQTLFFTLLICAETNKAHTAEKLENEYKYHFIIKGLGSSQYTELQNKNNYYKNQSALWPKIDFLGPSIEGAFSSSSYSAGFILNTEDPKASEKHFWNIINDRRQNVNIGKPGEDYTIEYTPRYTDDPSFYKNNSSAFTAAFIVFSVLSVLFGILFIKSKNPKRDDGSGERIYRSTGGESFRYLASRIFFGVMLLFGALALLFFLFNISLGGGAAYFFLYLFLVALCVLFLASLFNIRVNHYKFRYGIYMAFGANFRKLYVTSLSEMLVISLISAIPSFAATLVIAKIMYSAIGIKITVTSFAIISVIVLNIMTVLASTYIPMKVMAAQMPIGLLSAKDNSNYVSSPRRSARVFGKSFPNIYESLGMWRFRKYFIKLTASAVAFSTVFLCGLYIADTVSRNSENDRPEFTLTATRKAELSDADAEAIQNTLTGNGAIDYVFWSDSMNASRLGCHALVRSENVLLKKNAYVIETNSSVQRENHMNAGFRYTTDSIVFSAYNKALLDTICENGLYEIEGDPYSVLEDDKTVIISEYIGNRLNFDFNVGDKIILATPDFLMKIDEATLLGGNRQQALQKLIEESAFFYTEYTVGAIINYGGDDGSILFGLNYDAYSNILEDADVDDVKFMKELSVFTDKAATPAELEAAAKLLKSEMYYYDYEVFQSHATVDRQLFYEGAHNKIILTVSFLVMLLSPIIWFFSQLQFFAKRKKEIFILRSLGAVEKKIRRVYLLSGVMLSALSAVMTLVMSYIADFIIYLICTKAIPTLSPVGGVIVKFYMPPIALLMCLIVALLCGFLSSYLPYSLRKVLVSKSERYTSDGSI